MEDFKRILKETESLNSIDDKINHLLLRKRDTEIHIEKLKRDSKHTVFGWKLHDDLIALPEALQSEVNRLLILRSNNLIENNKPIVATDTTSDGSLKSSEAAKYLGIAKSTLYKRTSGKIIPFSKPGGKEMYFKKSDLDKYMQQNKNKTIEHIEKEAISYLQIKRKK